MNYKFAILALATIGLVIGCSDSQNQALQEKKQGNTVTKTEPSSFQQRPAPTSEPEPVQAEASTEIKTPTKVVSKTPEALEKDAQKIADTFIAKGSKTPRKELEQKIKKALEAAATKSSTTAGLTHTSK